MSLHWQQPDSKDGPPSYLHAYWYKIEFRCTQDHSNADGLSRLPLPNVQMNNTLSESEIFNVVQIDDFPGEHPLPHRV